ncbi:hypothetical protein CHARACLAT_022549 [Characodon lateralis]|uniref:Uncharacterized protein n=1 Tax=Characodon lateralis TaxID=208331 RepID=A0ABU7EEV5_9TELE|nr:hypothetical protein [Characodon lateralis]
MTTKMSQPIKYCIQVVLCNCDIAVTTVIQCIVQLKCFSHAHKPVCMVLSLCLCSFYPEKTVSASVANDLAPEGLTVEQFFFHSSESSSFLLSRHSKMTT